VRPERRSYHGRAIELRRRRFELDAEPELLVDDEPVPYGRLPDGQYYLHEYAYDWRDSLLDLTPRFIDYLTRADEVRRASGRKGAE
jgi:hypothetical protein